MREFLLGGESLRRLDIRNGRPVLVAARCANVVGASPDPETWRYQLDIAVPAGSMHASYPAAQVFHWRRAPSPLMPWRGRSVLSDAPALATLAHAVERSLLGEHSTPVSRVMDLRIPWRQNQSKKGRPSGLATDCAPGRRWRRSSPIARQRHGSERRRGAAHRCRT